VRRVATTADAVKRQARSIPFFDLWKQYHLEAAADFVEALRAVADKGTSSLLDRLDLRPRPAVHGAAPLPAVVLHPGARHPLV
jgi:hypothetical protein